MDAKTSISDFIHISDGKMHDVNALDMITILPYSFCIMDRGYLDFMRLYRIHTAQAYFLIRAKNKIDFERMYSAPVNKSVGIKCDQTIKLCGFYVSKDYPIKLRRIKFYWGRSPNAGKTQIWIAISVYVVVLILKKKLNLTQSIYEILQILSINTFDKEPPNELFSKSNLQYFKEQDYNQLKLFDL